jgi:hypothetical protein
MMPDIDFIAYSNLEQYLFTEVHKRFHKEHSIGAFDFFSIIVWKANRAKSRIAHRLRLADQKHADLESIVRSLTEALYATSGDRRLGLLLDRDKWGFRLPIASAILTVFWPDEFTVYDFRVCDQLNAFEGLANCTKIDRILREYPQFVIAVNNRVLKELSLRDKDRYLWGRSIAQQLDKDLIREFNTKHPA